MFFFNRSEKIDQTEANECDQGYNKDVSQNSQGDEQQPQAIMSQPGDGPAARFSHGIETNLQTILRIVNDVHEAGEQHQDSDQPGK